MQSSTPSSISDRARLLLKVLVEQYIRNGMPVGSRTLARSGAVQLSAASIRNVMADLDELGLVCSPHTSAGRVPTVRGYRFFIDSLLQPKALTEGEREMIREELLTRHASDQELLQSASDLLSELTRMAGVVTVPRREYAALRQIEFLPLSGGRVLAILVINQHEVENRILQTDRSYSPDELQRAANYLNSTFSGRDLLSVRESLAREVQEARAEVNQSIIDALSMGEAIFSADESNDYVLAGETNLMGFQELSSVDKLRGLFRAFEQKKGLLRLFDQCLDGTGVQIFVGEESGYQVLDDCSVVTAPYTIDDQVVGVIGVIGPTRMAYDRVVSIVDATAHYLGVALNSRN